jgi:hypothetical protein
MLSRARNNDTTRCDPINYPVEMLQMFCHSKILRFHRSEALVTDGDRWAICQFTPVIIAQGTLLLSLSVRKR